MAMAQVKYWDGYILSEYQRVKSNITDPFFKIKWPALNCYSVSATSLIQPKIIIIIKWDNCIITDRPIKIFFSLFIFCMCLFECLSFFFWVTKGFITLSYPEKNGASTFITQIKRVNTLSLTVGPQTKSTIFNIKSKTHSLTLGSK